MERSVVCGDVAHLGERSVRIAEVRGSSPLVSTTHTIVPPPTGGGFSWPAPHAGDLEGAAEEGTNAGGDGAKRRPCRYPLSAVADGPFP